LSFTTGIVALAIALPFLAFLLNKALERWPALQEQKTRSRVSVSLHQLMPKRGERKRRQKEANVRDQEAKARFIAAMTGPAPVDTQGDDANEDSNQNEPKIQYDEIDDDRNGQRQAASNCHNCNESSKELTLIAH